MRKRLARIALICIAMLYCLPLTAMAAGQGAPPEEPYEKVAAKSGSWYENRMNYDGKSNLVVGYTGDYEVWAEDSALEFSLSEKILLTGVYVPYEGADAGHVELVIEDSRGNVYQGFLAEQTVTGGIGEADKSGNFKGGQRNTLYAFTPEYEIALPKGNYTLYLDGDALPVDACLVKGYNHAAYERYENELMEWAREDEEEGPDELYIEFGNAELPELYRQFIEDAENVSEYEPAWVGSPRERLAPVFSLAREAVVDEMMLSTWHGGHGAHPGVISILDETGAEVISYKAQGASQGGAPNTMWVATPGVTLPAGDYFLTMDAPEALDYDESGEPVFYVGLSAPAAPPASFTGTYKIWLDLYKTHTLMGPVDEKESSFSLEDYELSVLDKGSVIELMGQYEGMPFSQNCEVTEREEDLVVAQFHFMADLTKLPYQANIAAVAEVTLKKESNGTITVGMTGEGFYSRAATKERGADENTYELTVRGGRVKKDLPPFVMAALAKAYGAGNIPGPDTPVEAAVGMLFPPLVGLVASAIQGLLRPKLERPLSVGEQAMKDANRSLGKGLYTEEEARAWATMADALGASGGDPEDAISIGDNERPGGADYVAPQESGQSGEGFGAEYIGPEEDLSFGKPDLPDEATPYEPYEQPFEAQPDMTPPAEPESMVVRTTAGGAETLIVRDPATGEWVNAETGNPFDLESHRKNFPQQMKEYEEYVEHNAELEKTGQTAMQQGLDEIDQKYRQELDAIQQEMNKRHLEQLRRDQEWLEKQMEHAHSTSGWGRIMGDWVRNMGDDVVDLGKATVVDPLVWTGEKLGTAAGTLVYDPESIEKSIKDAYASAKKSLASAVDEAERTVRDIRNDPKILVETWAHTGRDAYQMGKTVVKTAVDIATDPRKQLELAKDMLGVNDFSDSLDPNLPITGRVKKVLSGTFKLGTTLGTMGVGGAKAATTVGRVATTGTKTATKLGRAATGGTKTATTAGRVATTGSKTLAVKGIKPSLAVKTGPNYAAVKRSADLRGVSKTAKTVVQNTADEMGLQIKARTIKSADAGRMIEAGQAVPKRVNMKAKTLSILDEMLGGPKNSENLVGYYKPKMPPKDVWNTLSPRTKAELADLYKTRHREFRKLADPMKELQALGEYKLEGGLVRDLKQGGKFVTSDLDIHDIVNFDGTPVSESVKKQAYNRMMNYGRVPGKPPVQSTVMHEGTMSWTKASDKVGYSEKAKQSLIDGASKEGPGKGITSFNPLAKPTAEKYVR